jgi:hypothetical protein
VAPDPTLSPLAPSAGPTVLAEPDDEEMVPPGVALLRWSSRPVCSTSTPVSARAMRRLRRGTGRTGRRIQDALRRVGLTTEDVDLVVTCHLHRKA